MAILKRNATDRRSDRGRRLSLPNAHGKGVKLALFGRLLHQRGYVSGTDGNLSMRVGLDTVLVTPSGVSKGFMRSGDMVLVSLDGEKLAGSREPSSEVGLHLKIYKSRPDITAVVHAHP